MEYYNDSDDENIESVVDVSEKTAQETSTFILKRMQDIKSRSLLQMKTESNPQGQFNYEQDYQYWFAHVSGIQNFQENMTAAFAWKSLERFLAEKCNHIPKGIAGTVRSISSKLDVFYI